jgi:hypothetical protein
MYRRKIKTWKHTTRKIRGVRRKVKIHRKRVLDGYLVRVVRRKGRHHAMHRLHGKHHVRHHLRRNPIRSGRGGFNVGKQMHLFGSR